MSQQKPRVLVVEDDLSILTGVSMNLRYEGYEVIQAQDGARGLEMALTDGPDLIVLDVMMPRLNGYEVLRELRSRGVRTPVQSVTTVPDGAKPNYSTAEVVVHPSGKFLYGSNRGQNSIAIFTIDPKSGAPTIVGHQGAGIKTPRNFGIDPTGNFLIAANQDSDSLVVFRIDQKTGGLQPTGQKIEVPMPVCVKFVTQGP